jgi:flagellar assembly protein FliH
MQRAREEGIAQGRQIEASERREHWLVVADAARAQAHEEGRQQGRQEGHREGLGQVEREVGAARERVRRLEALLSSASDAVSAWRGEAEEDIVALAHEIACRVLGDSAAQPEQLRAMAQHVLRTHGASKVLEIRVNPEDFEQLGASDGDRWEWIADPSVPSGVLLRLPEGGLDARLESQLRAITDALLAHRRARRGHRAGQEEQG